MTLKDNNTDVSPWELFCMVFSQKLMVDGISIYVK